MTDIFDHGYNEWRIKRLAALIDYLGGAQWFRNKKILELGSGYGDFGAILWALGADQVFAEGRAGNVDVLRHRYKMIEPHKIIQTDLENGIILGHDFGQFDLIVHYGVLYHLDNWRQSIKDCAKMTKFLTLETEVIDSDDPAVEVKTTEVQSSADQSLSGTGSRPSAEMIEQVLEEAGFHYSRLRSSRANANIHRYDWTVTNSRAVIPGQRRMWYCLNTKALPPGGLPQAQSDAVTS